MFVILTESDPVTRLALCPRTLAEAGIAHIPWKEHELFAPVHWWLLYAGAGMIAASFVCRLVS
jgi:hypothetical protein